MDQPSGRRRAARPVRQVGSFGAGVATLGRGLGHWVRHPRLMLLGALPALLVAVLYLALLVTLFANLGRLTHALTGFAGQWNPNLRSLAEVGAGVAVVLGTVALAGLSFAAVTLVVAGPFCDRIVHTVERDLGLSAVEQDEPVLVGLGRDLREGVRLLVTSVAVGLLVFGIGLIPVAGPIVAIITGAVLGGRALTLELTATPARDRGLRLPGRRTLLRQDRARCLGFGAATYLLFLVPFGAVVCTPAATIGATLLVRDLAREAEPGQP